MIRIFCKKSSLQKNWPLVWTGCCWQPSSLQQIGPFLWSGSFAQKKCYLIPSSLLNAVGLCTKVTGCATNCRFSPFNQEAVTKPKAPFPPLSITSACSSDTDMTIWEGHREEQLLFVKYACKLPESSIVKSDKREISISRSSQLVESRKFRETNLFFC